MTPGVKRAALALHGLGAEDRSWILGRMSEGERGTLTLLLGELRELGIPQPPARVAVPQSPMDRIRAARAGRVAAVLRREPDRVIAACLSLEDWPWRDAVIAKLNRRRRDHVLAEIHDCKEAPRAPALEAALIASLDSRLSSPLPARWRQLAARLPIRAAWKPWK